MAKKVSTPQASIHRFERTLKIKYDREALEKLNRQVERVPEGISEAWKLNRYVDIACTWVETELQGKSGNVDIFLHGFYEAKLAYSRAFDLYDRSVKPTSGPLKEYRGFSGPTEIAARLAYTKYVLDAIEVELNLLQGKPLDGWDFIVDVMTRVERKLEKGVNVTKEENSSIEKSLNTTEKDLLTVSDLARKFSKNRGYFSQLLTRHPELGNREKGRARRGSVTRISVFLQTIDNNRSAGFGS